MTKNPHGTSGATPPAQNPTAHVKPARADIPILHADPVKRATIADQAWAIAHDQTATPTQIREACNIVIANVRDSRRDIARDLLRRTTGD